MKIRLYLYSIISIFLITPINAGFIGKLQEQFVVPGTLFTDVIQEKTRQLEEVAAEIAKRKEEKSAFTKKINSSAEQLKLQIARIEPLVEEDKDNEQLARQYSVLKEIDQVLKDSLRAYKDLDVLMLEYQKELEKYIQDSEFSVFAKEHSLQERLYYSFENLQELYGSIQSQERVINQLVDLEKNTLAERDTKKRNLSSIEKRYEQLKQELKQQQTAANGVVIETKNIQDRAERELQLVKVKKTLEKSRLLFVEYEIKIVNHKLFVARAQFEMLKKHVRAIKRGIRVSQADIAQDKEKLAKIKDTYFAMKDEFRKSRDLVSQQKKEEQRILDELSARFGVELGRTINEWSRQPVSTLESYQEVVQISLLNTKVLSLEKERQLYDAEIELQEEKFNYESLRLQVKETYNVINNRQFTSEDELTQEKQKYQTIKSDAKSAIGLYKEKINAAANLLNTQKKVIDNILSLKTNIQREYNGVFAGNELVYTEVITLINQAEEQEKKYVDLLGRLTGVYSGIVTELDSSMRLIDFIIDELQASTIWYRPAYAISWEGLRNIVPDSASFLQDVSSYVLQFSFINFFKRLKNLLFNPLSVLLLLGYLIVILLFYFFIIQYGIIISSMLLNKSLQLRGLLRIVTFLVGVFIRFMYTHAVGIVIWLSFGSISFALPDSYIHILYYLFSIPFLFYLAHIVIKLFMQHNQEHGYAILPEDFQVRFKMVISLLLYSTIGIFFFRQAFILSGYYIRSELPNILLAVNFIIFQLSLIFLITKEQVLSIIPERTRFWRSVKERVDQYFYPLLLVVVAVIVMSNPYVGFGRLVLYLLTSVFYTFLLFKGLLWGQALLKNAASFTFFETNNGVARERFSNAKTLFGLLIAASFLIAGFLGVLIGAKIWGWPVYLSDAIIWFNKPIMLQGTANPVTMYSLLQIILFILVGFGISYLLEKFVLSKIFDLLFVEAGIQHTIIRIAQYVIIFAALFLGFQNVGLGSLIGYMFGALALSVGWYIKDPISDFFAYFIILVQRPINIGDYIFVDDLTQGVVRKITARSVVLRRRNSTMIIVPNSHIVSRAIHNWNYIRSFVAFDDILITVSYQEDASKVRQLLLRVLDEHARILKNPKPIVRLHDFTDHGYSFLIRGFVSSSYTLDIWDIASEIRLAIVQAFHQEGVSIAVPIRIYTQEQTFARPQSQTKKRDKDE